MTRALPARTALSLSLYVSVYIDTTVLATAATAAEGGNGSHQRCARDRVRSRGVLLLAQRSSVFISMMQRPVGKRDETGNRNRVGNDFFSLSLRAPPACRAGFCESNKGFLAMMKQVGR